MKVVILAGGFGTRISEETQVIPKPMIQIGDYPILWHIMKTYSAYGFNEFVILCGYKGNIIKEYFAKYFLQNSSVTFDLKNNSMEIVQSNIEPWKVTCLDTGLNTMTGGRIKKAKQIVGDEPFLLTYGDGVCNINISDLISAHKLSKKLLTMSVIQLEGRFGSVRMDGNLITDFEEKRKGDMGWINGGYFVCDSKIFDYIEDRDDAVFERAPLEAIAKDGQINAYKHHGFWECMDTLADKMRLQKMWDENQAKWKVW